MSAAVAAHTIARVQIPAAPSAVSPMAETITVQIHGAEYKLRGDNAGRVHQAATMINDQMRFVASKAPTQPAATVAVLAALNTAEMLITEQEITHRESSELVRRIDSMTEKLEELLATEL